MTLQRSTGVLAVSVHCDLLKQRLTSPPLRRRTLRLLQQRSDERAFFGQERFGADEARVVAGALFISVCSQNRCAYRKRARRLDACYPWLADCGQRFLVPAKTKTGQAECCARLPVPRFFRDEHFGFAFRCFGCIT